MNRLDLRERIKTAAPGEVIVYHRGYLLRDRENGPNMLAINGLALEAWEAVEAGTVTAVQRRLGDWLYEYLLFKRVPPHKAVKWTGCYDPDHLTGAHHVKVERCERVAA